MDPSIIWRERVIDELLGSEPGLDEARAAIRETGDKIRNETDDARVEREARYENYVDAQGLFDALQGDDTVFIRGSWLTNQERGYVLPKRGELAPEALISADELRRSYEGRTGLAKTLRHPDPEGATTRLLQFQLKKAWHDFTELLLRLVLAVAGTADTRATTVFSTSLARNQPVVLSSRNLRVARHRRPRASRRLLGYADKGWTMFERALAGMIKSDSSRQIAELGDGLGRTWETPTPPSEPLSFREGHRYGDQVYTNGADRDKIVAPLFKTATEDILGGVTELRYFGQKWDGVRASASCSRCARRSACFVCGVSD